MNDHHPWIVAFAAISMQFKMFSLFLILRVLKIASLSAVEKNFVRERIEELLWVVVLVIG